MTGSLVLLLGLAGPIVLWQGASPEVRDGARSIAASLASLAGSPDHTFSVTLRGRDLDPTALDLTGVPIYTQAADGEGVLVGRMSSAGEALLAPHQAAACRQGCELLIAYPTRDLQEAIELILAPDGVDGELARARAELYPMLESTLIARLEGNLSKSVTALVAELPKEHAEELAVVAQDLERALEGETEDLISRLANRSWDTLGFWGATSGAARVAGGRAMALLDAGKDRALDWIGVDLEQEASEPRHRVDFLSREKKVELRRAIEDEVDSFWKREGDRILARAGDVIEQHSNTTLDGMKAEWMDTLRREVLERSWAESREHVLDAVSAYAEDFAVRRLVTQRRPGRGEGPTLPVAYAIRSSTRITRRPLLVLQPTEAATTTDQRSLALRPYADGLAPGAWERLAETRSPR